MDKSDQSCVISMSCALIKFLKVEKISDRGEILEALHRGAAQEGLRDQQEVLRHQSEYCIG